MDRLTNAVNMHNAVANLIQTAKDVVSEKNKWTGQCCSKLKNPVYCDSYGCHSLDELIAPIEEALKKIEEIKIEIEKSKS